MKRFLKPILFGVAGGLLVGLIAATVVFFVPRDNATFSFECFRLRFAVSDFLKDVKADRLDDAFDRIDADSSEDLRAVWTARVSELKNKENTYLSDFSDLKVVKKDGEFIVTVTLSVVRQGYNDPFYANGSVITVTDESGSWKISSISEYEYAMQTPFEQALSGVFAED
ncbi:MAG: hypothetical protein IIY12_06460 [Clostridia bacterium]|nr:hypothetical protein [Clostridia bacterium]MBQ1965490.1 hypothetical protein [Clostridia bacterium]